MRKKKDTVDAAWWSPVEPWKKREWGVRLFFSAAVVGLAGFGISIVIASFSDPGRAPTPGFTEGLCASQIDSLRIYEIKEREDLETAKTRAKQFKSIMTNPDSADFSSARELLVAEREIVENKERSLAHLNEWDFKNNTKEAVKGTTWVLILLTFSFCLYWICARRMLLDAVKAGLSVKKVFKVARRNYWKILGATLGFVTLSFSQTLFALAPQKTHAWSSYCVNWKAWLFHDPLVNLVASLGVVYPLALGSGTVQRGLVPRLDLTDKEQRAAWLAEEHAAHHYMSMVHKWTAIIVFTAGVPAILWIELLVVGYETSNPWYLLLGAGPVLVVLWLISALILNAHLLRRRYIRSLSRLKEDRKLYTDPTLPFLGKSVWKAPGVIITTWSVIAAIIKYTHLPEIFAG